MIENVKVSFGFPKTVSKDPFDFGKFRYTFISELEFEVDIEDGAIKIHVKYE